MRRIARESKLSTSLAVAASLSALLLGVSRFYELSNASLIAAVALACVSPLLSLVLGVRSQRRHDAQVAYLARPEQERAFDAVAANHRAMVEVDRRKHPNLYR